MEDRYLHPDGAGGFRISSDRSPYSYGNYDGGAGFSEVFEDIWPLPITVFLVVGLFRVNGYVPVPIHMGLAAGSGLIMALIKVFKYPNLWAKFVAVASMIAFVAAFVVWGH